MFGPRVQNDKLNVIMQRLNALEKGGSSGGVAVPPEDSRDQTRLVRRDCACCSGTGQRPGPLGMATPVPCNVCNTRGYNLVPQSWNQCRDCGGTGKQVYGMGITRMERKCGACGGVGWVQGQW